MRGNREIFRAARKAGGFKYRQIATKVGVDPSTICGYEGGRGNPSVDLQKKWKYALISMLSQRNKEMSDAILMLRKAKEMGNA